MCGLLPKTLTLFMTKHINYEPGLLLTVLSYPGQTATISSCQGTVINEEVKKINYFPFKWHFSLLQDYGSIAHEAKPNRLLTRDP